MQSLATASDIACPRLETAESEPIGKILGGRYRVVARLGAGGMGQVYVAEHQLLRSQVALKTLAEGLRNQPAAQRRFRREAELGATLRHPNLVRVFDFEVGGSHPYLVMDLLNGQDLRRLLADVGALDLVRAVRLIRGALAGLATAHAEGVVHRDMKPANLFVVSPGASESCKVLDFGVASVTGRSMPNLEPLTLSDGLLGTLAYMAPEQIRGARDVDARADVYSVAAILFETLSGRRLFRAETAPEQMFRVLNEKPPRLDELNLPLPSELADVVERALAHDPAARFADAAAFAQALEHFSESRASVMPSVSGRAPTSLRSVTLVTLSLIIGSALGYAADGTFQWAIEATPRLAAASPSLVQPAEVESLPVDARPESVLAASAANTAPDRSVARSSPENSARRQPSSRSSKLLPGPPPPVPSEPALGVERKNPYH